MTTICTYVYKNSIAKVISMIAKIATAFCGCSYITAGLTRYSIICTPTILAKIMQQYGVMFFDAECAYAEEDNVKNFLSGLEDCSASKSDKDDSVFVFLANYATELWYDQVA